MQVEQLGSDPVARGSAMEALVARFGEARIVTGEAIRRQHGTDESYHPTVAPDAVFFAESTEEVSDAVKICAAHKWPVIPFGVGTSLEGGVAALRGGLSIDMSAMNEILEVNAADLDVRVQAGVTRKQLNEYLRDTGLFFPIDPGANATLGGMSATRASGTNAVRYGTMRENVLSLTVVTADGTVVKTSSRAKKSAAGYDMTRLFVGSEGTLGVITEVQVKVYGIPEAISSAVVQFDDLESAINTCVLTIQSGVPVARMELLDDIQMRACIGYSKLEGFQEKPTLFFEFHGSNTGVVEQAETVQAIAGDFGGEDFKWATQAEERNKLWEARHNAYYAGLSLRPGAKGWPTDVCVPISRLAECIIETKKDLAEIGLMAPLAGHVGDGNFHLIYLVDTDNPDEMRLAKEHSDRMVLRAIAMGGTCTGEHGVGYGKIDFLAAELPEAIPLMRSVKKALDPDNIMNPGKLFRMN
jgi:D-lactate dehydrogenase (cytochrome)